MHGMHGMHGMCFEILGSSMCSCLIGGCKAEGVVNTSFWTF